MDLPIICSLTEVELRERRKAVLDAIRKNAVETAQIENGYSYSFTPSGEILRQLAHLVDLERQCCHFLTFKIVVEPTKLIALEITGAPEAKAVIGDYFGS